MLRRLAGGERVKRRIDGRAHVCSIVPGPLKAADEWLRFYEAFWSARFDVLDQLFKAQNEAVRARGKKSR